MNVVLSKELDKKNLLFSVFSDVALLAIIYYLPTISHLLAFPLYLLDPMRIVIFASIILTGNKTNSYILALTIPVFSFVVGGHPVFIKSLLICVELLVNVALFWTLSKKTAMVFLPTLLSILLSKIVYYSIKGLVIYLGLLNTEIISTEVYIQVVVAFAISFIMTLLFKKK